MLGVYELSIKRMSFDTGLTKEVIRKALEGFEMVKKVKYMGGYVVLFNFMKNQNMNPNMKKSACNTFNDLPESIKNQIVSDKKVNGLEGFERLIEGFEML